MILLEVFFSLLDPSFRRKAQAQKRKPFCVIFGRDDGGHYFRRSQQLGMKIAPAPTLSGDGSSINVDTVFCEESSIARKNVSQHNET